MDTATSIQESTQRPPQVGDKSVGFINDETLKGAVGIFMEQAKVIVRQEFKKQLEDKDHEISGRIAEDKGSEKNYMRRWKKLCGEWEF